MYKNLSYFWIQLRKWEKEVKLWWEIEKGENINGMTVNFIESARKSLLPT